MTTWEELLTKCRSWPLAAGLVCLLAGCANIQMGYNVLSYDTAVADTGNQMLLLNAVRASQRYPMSFTAVGQVLASPPVTGTLSSTLNFSNVPHMAGLTTYNVTPTVNANPGYTQFSLDNLNYQQFMKAIREPVPAAITNSFKESPYWPEGLRNVIYYQSLRPTLQSIAFIDGRRKSICSHPTSTFQYSLCAAIERNIAEYSDRCSAHFTDIQVRLREFQDGQSYFNTAVTYCHFSRFKIFMNEIRLVRQKFCEVYSLSAPAPPGCAGVTVTVRSALQMIEFLGEIIAAQNFIDLPFMPTVIIGISTPRGSFEFVDVPLFVVKRGGLAAEPVAISVSQNGVTYYIPQPDVGSPVEERSLQTLDLVLQSLRAASFREDMPKVPTFGVVTK